MRRTCPHCGETIPDRRPGNPIMERQGEATRIAIVQALRLHPGASVREITDLIGLRSYGTTYQHIKKLLQAGRIVETRPHGTRRWAIPMEAPRDE